MKRDPGVDPANEATTVTRKPLLLVAVWCWHNYQLDALVPRNFLEAEATDCEIVAHGMGQP